MNTGKRLALVLTPLLISLAPARAEEKWDELIQEWNEAQDAWVAEMRQGNDDHGMVKIDPTSPGFTPPADKFRERFYAYAKAHANKPEAVPALAWLVSNEVALPGTTPSQHGAKWAIDRLKRDHADDPGIMDHLEHLRLAVESVGKEPVISLLEAIVHKNKHRETVAAAKLALAELLCYGSPMAAMFAGAEDGGAQKRTDRQIRGEKMLRTLKKEFADTDIAERADELLFAMDHLQVGKEAPELAGKGADGQEIRLSTYRGNVVAIVFWATWCSPCMQMIPHEKELVEKHADQPFTLLGINADPDFANFKKAVKKEQITWPNIYDGFPGEGPIIRKWRIQTFPTVFVVDHKGVIRHRGGVMLDLDGTVESLLSEATSSPAD